MTQVTTGELIAHSNTDVRNPDSIVLKDALPDTEFDERELFRTCIRAIRKHSSNLDNKPDLPAHD